MIYQNNLNKEGEIRMLKIKDGVSEKMVFIKSKMKYNIDLEKYYNKDTRELDENEDTIIPILDFLQPLNFVERVGE